MSLCAEEKKNCDYVMGILGSLWLRAIFLDIMDTIFSNRRCIRSYINLFFSSHVNILWHNIYNMSLISLADCNFIKTVEFTSQLCSPMPHISATPPFPPDAWQMSGAPCQMIVRQLSGVCQMPHQTSVRQVPYIHHTYTRCPPDICQTYTRCFCQESMS